MKTAICAMLGIDFPLIAFTHCADVVVAVTNAGGLGVLGASGRSPAQLDDDLAWIDARVAGRPYGVDIVCPASDTSTTDAADPARMADSVPDGHRHFVNQFLKQHDLPFRHEQKDMNNPMRVDHAMGQQLLDVAFRHPIALVANALGVPPRTMIDTAHSSGVLVAGLVGTARHAVEHVAAGVDFVVAQGTEAGGHTGEISTLVLVPEVIEALRHTRHVPVIAAGGIVTGRQMAAAMALGAEGVWTGSVWLTTAEAETPAATVSRMLEASSTDAVRSRSRTGKPCRQLRSTWTDAWDADASPPPLPMPFQSLLSEPVLRRVDQLAESDSNALACATYFVGQGVGLLRSRRHVRDVINEMLEDFVDAIDGLTATLTD
ncbi:nitronate monooxygenase [Rhodococcus ruber]|uniref:Nitronate monooxygenase n=1 Tax=Rhodococcus ruber TaxID=1830 RepID=A0ABT4MET0_9NOCA|nr:nitronate monooxygenase [Rhodococcus ruber]MCZ4519471.1 nitronate monooxygenase [Rhodococcus ruber]